MTNTNQIEVLALLYSQFFLLNFAFFRFFNGSEGLKSKKGEAKMEIEIEKFGNNPKALSNIRTVKLIELISEYKPKRLIVQYGERTNTIIANFGSIRILYLEVILETSNLYLRTTVIESNFRRTNLKEIEDKLNYFEKNGVLVIS